MSAPSQATYQVEIKEVEYLSHDGQPLLARIYQPLGTGPFPTMIDIHGGAWNMGDRTNDEPIDRYLAERGLLVAAVDFRQAPATRYPVSMTDIKLRRPLAQSACRGVQRPAGCGGWAGQLQRWAPDYARGPAS